MSLQTIMEQIKIKRPFAEENLDEGPSNTISGRRGRKREAVEAMGDLQKQYGLEVVRTAAFILVTGSESLEFAKTAVDKYKCFSADPEALYSELTDLVPAVVYENRTVGSAMVDVLLRHLEDKANDLGVVGYPLINLRQEHLRTITDRNDFLALVKQLINEQVGSELTAINAARSVVDEAIRREHVATVTPIVLVVQDDRLALDLLSSIPRLGSQPFLVVAGTGTEALAEAHGIRVENGSKKNVEQALTVIRKNVRK